MYVSHICITGMVLWWQQLAAYCCILLIDPTQNIIKDNERTSMNERNTFLYKKYNISLIFSITNEYLFSYSFNKYLYSSLPVEIQKTQPHVSTIENPALVSTVEYTTTTLNGRISTDVFSKSSNFQDHLFWAWCHPHSSPISCLGFIMTNGDCHILSARASNCTKWFKALSNWMIKYI